MIKIDKRTHDLEPKHYRKTISNKTQIVIASTLRANGNHIVRQLHQNFGLSKKWNTFTITRAGKIYQHYDPKYQSDFLENKIADPKIISISLENMGYLDKNKDGLYVNWLNEICDSDLVVERKLAGYNYWEVFTAEQLDALAYLCAFLCEEFNIPKNIIDFMSFHKDIHKFKGLTFRSNYIENTNDINPLFDVEYFDEKLNSVIL